MYINSCLSKKNTGNKKPRMIAHKHNNINVNHSTIVIVDHSTKLTTETQKQASSGIFRQWHGIFGPNGSNAGLIGQSTILSQIAKNIQKESSRDIIFTGFSTSILNFFTLYKNFENFMIHCNFFLFFAHYFIYLSKYEGGHALGHWVGGRWARFLTRLCGFFVLFSAYSILSCSSCLASCPLEVPDSTTLN